jgi:NADH-quinone oxidoreductase E subunit
MTLRDEVARVAERYPNRHSAVLEALRLAQERHEGWLPPQALVEVADALEVTPAYVRSIATFYDLLHLEPVGRHSVDVCTNLACALVGAQHVVEAFEQELGVAPGETTADGGVTFRTVECLGGCGYATVVAVDGRYRQFVKAEDVPAIVEEVRGGAG